MESITLVRRLCQITSLNRDCMMAASRAEAAGVREAAAMG